MGQIKIGLCTLDGLFFFRIPDGRVPNLKPVYLTADKRPVYFIEFEQMIDLFLFLKASCNVSRALSASSIPPWYSRSINKNAISAMASLYRKRSLNRCNR
jgi:hypothetical protein